MDEKRKINWLLILQGWAMLWVVIGHSYLGEFLKGPAWETKLCNIAYSFHMPLFMLVSGWLFWMTRLKPVKSSGGGQILAKSEETKGLAKRQSRAKSWRYRDIIKDKSLRLLLPGLVFSIVAFALKLALPGEMSRQIGLNLNDILHAYLYPYDNPLRELWFIVTLFWLMMLGPLWHWALSSKVQGAVKWGMLVALTVLYFWHPDIELLCIDKVTSHAIWFYLGLLMSEEGIVERYMEKRPWKVMLIGMAFYGMKFLVHGSMGGFIATIGGITFSFGLALILDRYLPKAFFSFRNYTYQIFLMGIFAQIAVKIAYRHVAMPYAKAYVICILAGLYVPVVVSKMIEWINWKPLLMSVGLKK